MHFHGWRKGLKTGMYYLRTRGAAEPIPFTLPVKNEEIGPNETFGVRDGREDCNGMVCESCSA